MNITLSAKILPLLHFIHHHPKGIKETDSETNVSNENGSMKFFLSYVEMEAKAAAVMFKAEVEKLGHKCWINISAQNKGAQGIEDGVRKCNIVIPFLTKSYICSKACLMELAWAMKYRKKVQPLHLPMDKFGMEQMSILTPKGFGWIFNRNMLPIDDADVRLMRSTLPIILKDAVNAESSPRLPDKCNAEEVVEQAMDYVIEQKIKEQVGDTSSALHTIEEKLSSGVAIEGICICEKNFALNGEITIFNWLLTFEHMLY